MSSAEFPQVAEPPVEETPQPNELPPVPEVRQCQDPEDSNYGCAAVKSAVPFGAWMVANPGVVNINSAGGHWEVDDKVVENWEVLS
jgi:hypothetical protein